MRRQLAQRLTEASPSLRWHVGRLKTRLLYRHAFAAFGEGSVIVRPHVLRGLGRITIGRRCAIYDGVWLACEPEGEGIVIGNDNYFGHGVHIHSIDRIEVGSRCTFADEVFVATTDHDRSDRAAVHGTGPIVIGDDVFIGQRAVVLGGVRIGDRATVGAHAVVTSDVPAGAVVAGVPARIVGSSS